VLIERLFAAYERDDSQQLFDHVAVLQGSAFPVVSEKAPETPPWDFFDSQYSAYISRFKRADEWTRTADPLIMSELFHRSTWASDFPRISCQLYLPGAILGEQGTKPCLRVCVVSERR
jgi:hypothetical protein